VTLDALIQQALVDINRFSPVQQADILSWSATMQDIVAGGPGGFDNTALVNMLNVAVPLVSLLSSGECDGFLIP
jgi:hypothetical protein